MFLRRLRMHGMALSLSNNKEVKLFIANQSKNKPISTIQKEDSKTSLWNLYEGLSLKESIVLYFLGRYNLIVAKEKKIKEDLV